MVHATDSRIETPKHNRVPQTFVRELLRDNRKLSTDVDLGLDGLLSGSALEMFRKTCDTDQHDRFLNEHRALVFRLKSEFQERTADFFDAWKFGLIRAQSEPPDEKAAIWQRFRDTPPCDLEPFFERRLQRRQSGYRGQVPMD